MHLTYTLSHVQNNIAFDGLYSWDEKVPRVGEKYRADVYIHAARFINRKVTHSIESAAVAYSPSSHAALIATTLLTVMTDFSSPPG